MCTALKLHCFMWLIVKKYFLKETRDGKSHAQNNGLTEGFKGSRALSSFQQ